jgi:hypothetical protein
MPHWRKSYPQTSQFNSLAIWVVGASMLAGALVLIARHVYIKTSPLAFFAELKKETTPSHPL